MKKDHGKKRDHGKNVIHFHSESRNSPFMQDFSFFDIFFFLFVIFRINSCYLIHSSCLIHNHHRKGFTYPHSAPPPTKHFFGFLVPFLYSPPPLIFGSMVNILAGEGVLHVNQSAFLSFLSSAYFIPGFV